MTDSSQGAAFRRRVIAGEVVVGVFLSMGSPVSAEISARECDWVVIDLEHGLGSEAQLLAELQAVSGHHAAAIVRIETSGPLRTSRVLDHGASGIMVPRVETAAAARELVSFLRYPPGGRRGVAFSSRALGYGTLRHDQLSDVDDSVLCIAQIESAEAIANADEIAAVDGIDVLFVGPSDLTHALGIPGRVTDPLYTAAIEHVAAAARASGKACGVLARPDDDVDRYLALGFTVMLIGADSILLAEGVASATAEMRSRLAGYDASADLTIASGD